MVNDHKNDDKKGKTNDAQCNCSLPPAQCQMPFPKLRSTTPPGNFPPVYWTGVEHPFGQLGSPVPPLFPLSFF